MQTNTQHLWTRDFTLITAATALGCAGGIAGEFALSFLVFDETGSTLASATIIAIQMIPWLLIPLFVAPVMDRLPRKAFLVGGDLVNGISYIALGLWLARSDFSYGGYLVVSTLLSSLSAIDSLAYTSLYPSLIPTGAEQKGYAVSSMLYPVISVLMTPVAALLLDLVGVPLLLMAQGVLSMCAAFTESFIRVEESHERRDEPYGLTAWAKDVREAVRYISEERGLQSIFAYMAVSNGLYLGYSPALIAFFRTTPGLSATLYGFFSVAEFIGRSIGGVIQYRVKIPNERKFSFVLGVYATYELMDAILLWLPYPAMLANRAICGLLGNNSMVLREAAVQAYIPEKMRSRINAFCDMLITAAGSLLALLVGGLGELLDYRWCLTVSGMLGLSACVLIIWNRRADVRKIYEV